MTANKTITATFGINMYTLDVTLVTGLDGGSVTKNPNLPSYPHGSTVQLTAVPVDGQHHFIEWGGAAASFVGTNPISLTMDGNKAVTASFALTEFIPPVVTVIAPNGGELYIDGQLVEIDWSATDQQIIPSIDILLSRSGPGGPFETLASAIGNSGAFLWHPTLPATTNAYIKIVALDGNGNPGQDLSDLPFSITARSVGVDGGLPREFALGAVFPTPCVESAHVVYDLPREAQVRLSLIDLQGREVTTLVDGTKAAGRYLATWDGGTRAGRAAPGIYFVRFETPGHAFVRRIVLTR